MPQSSYLRDKVNDKSLRNTDYTVTTVFTSLHTADPGLTGANEVSGGAGPYARQSTAFAASSGGLADNSAIEDFTGMPGATVVAVGAFDALSAGNFLGFAWLTANGDTWKPFISDAPANDTLSHPSHGYINDDRVVVSDLVVGTTPTGLTNGTLYHVVSATVDTFKVSLTQGGAAVDITADGSGLVRRVTPRVVTAGDTVRIPIGNLDITQR